MKINDILKKLPAHLLENARSKTPEILVEDMLRLHIDCINVLKTLELDKIDKDKAEHIQAQFYAMTCHSIAFHEKAERYFKPMFLGWEKQRIELTKELIETVLVTVEVPQENMLQAIQYLNFDPHDLFE